jgi:hypothetical protein
VTCDTHSKRPHLSVVKFLKNKALQNSVLRTALCDSFLAIRQQQRSEIMKEFFIRVKPALPTQLLQNALAKRSCKTSTQFASHPDDQISQTDQRTVL